MAKVRVYELAKELNVESKAVMAKLQEFGEFVRSASSTIEAPVVRKLRESFPKPAAAPAAPPAPPLARTARTADKPRAADAVAAPAPSRRASAGRTAAAASARGRRRFGAEHRRLPGTAGCAAQAPAPGDSAAAYPPGAPGAARPAAGRPAPRPGPAVRARPPVRRAWATTPSPRRRRCRLGRPLAPAAGARSPAAPTRPGGMPPRPRCAAGFGATGRRPA